MIEDTLKQVNIYLDKQIKELRDENERLIIASQMQPSIYGLIEQERRIETKDKRIAELEAQVPKVVAPLHQIQLHTLSSYTGICTCTCNLMSYMAFCPNCGAKLSWTEVEK